MILRVRHLDPSSAKRERFAHKMLHYLDIAPVDYRVDGERQAETRDLAGERALLSMRSGIASDAVRLLGSARAEPKAEHGRGRLLRVP